MFTKRDCLGNKILNLEQPALSVTFSTFFNPVGFPSLDPETRSRPCYTCGLVRIASSVAPCPPPHPSSPHENRFSAVARWRQARHTGDPPNSWSPWTSLIQTTQNLHCICIAALVIYFVSSGSLCIVAKVAVQLNSKSKDRDWLNWKRESLKGRPFLKSGPFKWALPFLGEGGGGVNVCQGGLGHFLVQGRMDNLLF